MAYDQSYYQQPQRAYNGPVGQRPRPPPQQGPPLQQQQYPPQHGYEEYGQEQYYDDGYDNVQDENYGGYQGINGGRGQDMHGGRGNEYAPQQAYPLPRQAPPQQQAHPPPRQAYPPLRQAYPPLRQAPPPQQDYYGEPRGGRGMQPSNRGRGAPMQRPGTADGYSRGGFDQRGGGGGGGFAPAPSMRGAPRVRGGRPTHLDRNMSTDPGVKEGRRQLKTPPISPDVQAWDNPFPTFPNAKKKTARDEERQIIQRMEALEVGDQPQGRPRGSGSKGSQDRYQAPRERDDYGMPRPSIDSQRSLPNRAPPPMQNQGYPDPRRGPPGLGPRDPSRQHGFQDSYNDQGYGTGHVSPSRSEFGPPGRSMTMPNQVSMGQLTNGQQNGRQPQAAMMDPVASERPYNGPIGRGLPPRPSTATGTRQPPQRMYPNEAPPRAPVPVPVPAPAPAPAPAHDPQQSQFLADPYANMTDANGMIRPGHESVSDLYDAYYEPQGTIYAPRHSRSQSHGNDASPLDMGHGNSGNQSFDMGPPNTKVPPFNDNYLSQEGSYVDSQTSYQAPARMMQYESDSRSRIQPQAAVFEMADDAPELPNQYPPTMPEERYKNSQYSNQQPGYGNGPQNGLPPRTTSAASGRSGPALVGPPRQGFNGLPNGPSPNIMANGRPPPVRAGLIPNSVASIAADSNKPAPVRTYNNVPPLERAPSVQPATLPAPPPGPKTPPPVTQEEIDSLKAQVANVNLAQPSDHVIAMTYVKKLVEACNVLIPKIPDQKHRNKAREHNVMAASKLLKKLIAAQNTDAMFYMADCYGRGALGLEPDNKEAFSLYQSAAKGGHPQAAYRTAVCCELGNEEGGGTRKDSLKAIQWYKRAAILGDIPATYKMGMIQLKGLLGQPKDLDEAVKWLKAAADKADHENPHALHELGNLFMAPQNGSGQIVRDEAYAFRFFQQAADLGYKFSQFKMGSAYEYGLHGCQISPRDSIMWYSRAAVQEEHQSELALSGWYLTGSEGVLQQSDAEAYLWARRAAMAGNDKAEYAMGYFTEVGIGIPANLEDAKRWYWRAAAQSFPKARARLEELKKGGKGAVSKPRERVSRSNVGKQQEGECAVM